MTEITSDSSIYQSLGLVNDEKETASNSELTQQDFMDLLVTELTYQDPFEPMDNSELASQISQFSVVSGIDELNNSFSTFSSSMLSGQTLQASGLIGHDVLVPTNTGYLETGDTLDGVIGLDSSAGNVKVMVKDSSGAVIREISLGTQPEGEVNFSWDGLMDNGEYAPTGTYQIEAEATVNDETIAPYVLNKAEVESVSMGTAGQDTRVNLKGLGSLSLNDVAEIY